MLERVMHREPLRHGWLAVAWSAELCWLAFLVWMAWNA